MTKTTQSAFWTRGCGAGTHALLMAKTLENADMLAIGINPDYIRKLNSRAKELQLHHRVIDVCMSMFDAANFDRIYAEGPRCIAGFTQVLEDWKSFLKPKGIIVCSEISWIVDSPSAKTKAMLGKKVFPNQAQGSGYELLDYFIVPQNAWTENHYVPLQRNLDVMNRKYVAYTNALEALSGIQEEIDLYHQFGDDASENKKRNST